MKRSLVSLSLGSVLVSCGVGKSVGTYDEKNIPIVTKLNGNLKLHSNREKEGRLASKIISNAESYLGVPYKLGGNTPLGMDCSGLVVKVFEENDLKITRRSEDQAKEGAKINIKEVKTGDLLFFATTGESRVSHVGIVHTVGDNGEIKFIHASTRRGVIISSLSEMYWSKAFLFARRVL